MQNLQAFAQSMRATAQYYPIEFDVAYGWDADKRQWKRFSIKCDQCHEAALAAAAKADGGHIFRRNGFFVN